MTASPPRLGIIDWGIGGLGVLAALDRRVPDLPVVYASDTGFAPYGLVPTAVLADRLRVLVGVLADRGCTEVVLACNAASTVVDRLGDAAVPVEGIIGHGIASVPDEVRGTIGVVAGRRTIASGAYRRALARPDRTVVSRVAQPLSAHIEAGRVGTSAFEADLRRIVAPLRGAGAVLLACTHYPAAVDHFAAQLPGTQLLDPAEHAAAAIVGRLGPSAPAGRAGRSGGADRVVLTTGDRRAMRRSARLAWGIDLPDIDRLRLPSSP